jgi:hypothetical protein
MDKVRQKRRWAPAIWVVLALLSLSESGCLLVAAGAAGGAAAGYAYYRGKVCQAYCANFEDAWAAVHTALTELGMPILSEERHGAEAWIKSQTAEADRVRIKLEVIPSKIPADGPLTQVSVRVGAFGDHPVSERVLCQIGAHLIPSPALAPQTGVYPASVPPPPLTPQTTEPPLTSSSADLSKPTTAPLLPPQPLPAAGK